MLHRFFGVRGKTLDYLEEKHTISTVKSFSATSDKKSGDEVMQLLRKLQSEYGQTIIMVIHDPDIASSADRVIRIEDGKIV